MLSAIRPLQVCSLLFLLAAARAEGPNAPPAVGGAAPDFTLKSPADRPVHLEALAESGPVVVVVLRGWSGFQDSFDTQQVADLVRKTAEFRARGARVVLVYPGEAEGLKGDAEGFVAAKNLPDNFALVIDPDFAMTKAYNLRWDAPGETAYPATFVIGPGRRVAFAKVSRQHGGRAQSYEILQALGG
jgi:peroxiredoxin